LAVRQASVRVYRLPVGLPMKDGMRIWGWRPSDGAAAVRVLLLSVLVFVLPMVVTLQLKHVGERGVQAERDLQTVVTELQVQDGLEWRAISGRVPSADLSGQLAGSRARAKALLAGSVAGGLRSDDAQVIAGDADTYSRAVDQELRLLSAAQPQEAEALDEQQVDPAFEHLRNDLANDAGKLSGRAARARRFSDVGLLVTVLLALGLTAVVQSRRKRAEVRRQAERAGEARYRALIDQSADLVLVTDRTGVVRFVSPSAQRLLAPTALDRPKPSGAADAAVDLIAAVAPTDRVGLLAALQAATPGEGSSVEVRVPRPDGTRTFEVTVVDLTDQASVGGLVLTAHDLTERLTLQREMEHRALLADRFAQALAGEQRTGTSTGLLLIDLDRFKEINDTFGHHYGDALLTQVGPRLTGVLRDVDTVARLGGDEFAVLLPDIRSVQDVTAVADKLQAALTAPFHVQGVDLDVEASIGAVLSGEHGTDPTSLLQRADIAMYVAKTQNLGVFAYNPAVDGHSPAELALLGDLRRALDTGQLLLHFQPKVSISTGEVIGAEALVRWQHPDHGLLFPDTFIPLAEHTGLIGPLTRYVLTAALTQARVWADAGRPLPVSVNLSARNLLDERLPAQVAELLAVHGVAPELLELEVTESAIMTEPARAQRLLEALAALGVRLSIDDFGAGYTSLGQLKTLPVTELKIDRSFVLTMTEDTSNALIVRSVVDLGHNLGLTLVAEGVETGQALTLLADYGCDVAQGYHLSRPITAAALDTWRTARHLPVSPHSATAATAVPAVPVQAVRS